MSEPGMHGSDNSQQDVPPEATQAIRSPGAQLGAQREALGWSIEHVANQLNLAIRQVQALEQDNYAALPGNVIARGFMRSYAKLLKMDPVPLVAMMAEKDPPVAETLQLRRALSPAFSESKLPPLNRVGNRYKRLMAAAALLVSAAIGWQAYQKGWFAASPNQAGANSRAADAAEMPPAELNAEEQSRVPQSQEAATAVGGVPDAPVNGASAAAPESAVSQQMAATAAPAGNGAAVNSSRNLILKVREASWIEIKRADGVTMVSRVVPAGATESFGIDQPVVIIIGNAKGVDVDFQGKILDLKAKTKGNVARLNLQ